MTIQCPMLVWQMSHTLLSRISASLYHWPIRKDRTVVQAWDLQLRSNRAQENTANTHENVIMVTLPIVWLSFVCSTVDICLAVDRSNRLEIESTVHRTYRERNDWHQRSLTDLLVSLAVRVVSVENENNIRWRWMRQMMIWKGHPISHSRTADEWQTRWVRVVQTDEFACQSIDTMWLDSTRYNNRDYHTPHFITSGKLSSGKLTTYQIDTQLTFPRKLLQMLWIWSQTTWFLYSTKLLI